MENYRINGTSVTKYSPKEKNDRPPVVMIHGGNHGSWCWASWANLFKESGYEVHAFDWYNHGESDELPESEFIARGMEDIAAQELTDVVNQFDRPPILIGHSMGSLVAAIYAASHKVERLVLTAPVLPKAAQASPIPLPVDLTKPVQVFPYPQAKQMFFTKSSDAEAQEYYKLLVPESPQVVSETVNWSIDLDINAIQAPTLVIADEFDQIIPHDALKRYTDLLGASYRLINGVGHSDLLLKEPEAQDAARQAIEWIET